MRGLEAEEFIPMGKCLFLDPGWQFPDAARWIAGSAGPFDQQLVNLSGHDFEIKPLFIVVAKIPQ